MQVALVRGVADRKLPLLSEQHACSRRRASAAASCKGSSHISKNLFTDSFLIAFCWFALVLSHLCPAVLSNLVRFNSCGLARKESLRTSRSSKKESWQELIKVGANLSWKQLGCLSREGSSDGRTNSCK
mmetsp:Transcript_42247/g.84678  ORF Transcript_42247/g.84678 Transcript_42247/m.84678 type:complete len:129 (+) Transcript_42247:1470-1856(+)